MPPASLGLRCSLRYEENGADMTEYVALMFRCIVPSNEFPSRGIMEFKDVDRFEYCLLRFEFTLRETRQHLTITPSYRRQTRLLRRERKFLN